MKQDSDTEQVQMIKTQRLQLRKLIGSDRDDFFAYRALAEVVQYQSFRPKEIAEIDAFLAENENTEFGADNTWFQLGICLENGQLIGDIGIHFLDDGRQAELGYTLDPSFQGKGYAREAVRAVIGYLFESCNIHRVTASVDPENGRSILLLEALGFRKEAHFVESYFTDGIWCDDCIYALLKKEWI